MTPIIGKTPSLTALCLATALGLLTLSASARAGTNPYCPSCGGGASGSPEARYEQYQSTLQGQKGGATAPKLFVAPGSSPTSQAQPFYLKGIMENPTATKYGMQYRTSTPAQPFPMAGGKQGAQNYATTEQLQAMAVKDQQANLKSALTDSAERMRKLKELQDAWAQQQGLDPRTGAPPPAGAGDPARKEGAPPANIKYIYKKSDPTKLERPARVFLDTR